MLVGTVLDQPSETRSVVRFNARFLPHVETEVTVSGAAREEARKVNAGDRIRLEKLANIGPCKIASRSVTRLVNVKTEW